MLAIQRLAGNAAVAAKLGGAPGSRRPLPPREGAPPVTAMRRPAIAAVQRDPTPNRDVLPAPVSVTWGGDPFVVGFERSDRDGGRFEFVVRYTGDHPFDGPGASGTTTRVSATIGAARLKARVVRTEGGSIDVDLYGDGSRVVRLRDAPVVDERPDRGRRHDLDVIVLGRSVHSSSVWVADPSARPGDLPVPTPQERPGENPRTLLVGEGARQIDIDGDGDQSKELRLTLRTETTWDDGGAARGVALDVRQRSSGQGQVETLGLPKPSSGGNLFPVVREVTDGRGPTRISLVSPLDTRWLEIDPPERDSDGVRYPVRCGSERFTVTVPPDAGPARRIATADEVRHIGNIVAVDMRLGAYDDRFRLTIEPRSDTEAVFGLAVLGRTGPRGGVGATLQVNGPLRYRVLQTDATNLGIDLDGDGAADLQVYDRLTTPEDVDGGGPPEANRNHDIRVTGRAVGEDRTFRFRIRDGFAVPAHGSRPQDRDAEANALAVTGLEQQAAEGTFEQQLDALESGLMATRQRAAEAGIIRRETYEAWAALSQSMIRAQPQVPHGVEGALQAQTALQAQAFYEALAADTRAELRPVPHSFSSTNRYTDEMRTIAPGYSGSVGAGPELAGDIRAGRWDHAFRKYRRLVSGFDDWVVERLRSVRGERSAEAQEAELLTGRRRALAEIESHRPRRLLAVFNPSERFRTEEGFVSQIPLNLYTYQEGGSWHLKDLTNPSKPWDYTVDVEAGDSATEPPYRLLTKLDDPDHFPDGAIHYQIPGGRGGEIRTRERLTWKKFLTYLGVGLAAVGLTLSTFGTGTVAVVGMWALAGSALAGGVSAGIDLAERAGHGHLDTTTAIIDVAQIVGALAGVSALAAGRIVRGAIAAADAGRPLVGGAAQMAALFGRAYVPLVGTRMASDAVTVVAMTVDAARQLDAIENGPGDRAAKDRAKALLLAQLAVTGGITALSIRGELPSLGQGRRIELHFPDGQGPPVANVAGMELPAAIRFSQKDVGHMTGDKTMTIEQLTESMRTHGWRGDPIHVVELPDGARVSLDNRRLLAARRAGLTDIPVTYHHPNEPFRARQWAAEGFVLEKTIRRLPDGSLVSGGTTGEIAYAKGSLPSTWGEAALFRTANQGNVPEGGRFPLGGRLEEPRVRRPRVPSSP